MPAESAEVAVLGAGIAGCALAHHLAERGVRSVVVFDPRTTAGGATGRAAGIVTEQLWNAWDVEVVRESKEEYAGLARRHDPSAYAVQGFARWTRDPIAAGVLDGAIGTLRAWNVGVDRLDAEGLARRVPFGSFEGVRAAMWSAGDAVVTPSSITEIYADSARRQGVEFALGSPFGSIGRSGGRWDISFGSRTVRAARIVLAAGAWTKRLLERLGAPAPLAPYRTQAAVLRPSIPAGPSTPSVHDLDDDVYARPEAAGRILAGDGTELVEVDPETYRSAADDSFVAHLAACFEQRLPGWADAELVRAWAGVCVATPDRRPLVGPVPGPSGLFALAGFNGFGVMRAGGVARRLSALLAAGDGPGPALDALAPVMPGRFGPKIPKFEPRPGFTLEGGDDPRF